MTSPSIVTVDTHTAETALASRLAARGVTIERAPLHAGDVSFTARRLLVGVERKETQDLVASWVGRKMRCKPDCPLCGGRGCHRLDNQLDRMLKLYDRAVLLVVGWFTADAAGYILSERRRNAVLWHGLMNALHRWQAAGVILDFAVDTDHAAERIVKLRDYLIRGGG